MGIFQTEDEPDVRELDVPQLPLRMSSMTLRDYFAAQALLGDRHYIPGEEHLAALRCYAIADAMLAERLAPPLPVKAPR